jgi:hypothetical protein
MVRQDAAFAGGDMADGGRDEFVKEHERQGLPHDLGMTHDDRREFILYRDAKRDHPLITHGQGATLYAAEGKSYLDGCGGPFVVTIGHGVKEIAEAMARRYPHLNEALENTLRIAGDCSADIGIGKLVFPAFETPDGSDAFEHLREECYRAAERRPQDDPQRAREVAELCGQSGPHQRPWPGDGREVVSEQDPLVGRLEVVPVAEPFGRGRPLLIQCHHLGGDELRIETVADEKMRNPKMRTTTEFMILPPWGLKPTDEILINSPLSAAPLF